MSLCHSGKIYRNFTIAFLYFLFFYNKMILIVEMVESKGHMFYAYMKKYDLGTRKT